jgi:UDP-glucuronate 4-epimerase
MLQGEKILITGPTSQVAFPLARELAKDNEVHGLARFRRQADREQLESVGVKCIQVDLAENSLARLADDFTFVLNFAVVKSGQFDYDMAANVEGVGRLMSRCRAAKAFLHCSSGSVYQYAGHRPLRESDPLGDNHRVWFPTYSICKIAAESMVRFGARQWNLPAVIARMSVPYGNNGGWPLFHLAMMKEGQAIPVHPEKPSIFNPIHEDDYIAHVPKLLAIATVPAVTLNWGGSENVSIEEWCQYMGTLTGLEAKFHYTQETIGSLPLDLRMMHSRLGKTNVPWRDGIRRMVEAYDPELIKG